MILRLTELVARYDLRVGTVLHLGAHLGEEQDAYVAIGAHEVVWIEADPSVCVRLASQLHHHGQRAVQALISDVDDEEVEFFRTNNEVSSSLLPMHLHRRSHPDVAVTGSITLRTTTVDSLCEREAIPPPDLLVLDLQGAELLALRGASRTLSAARAVYSEVSAVELYEGCPLLSDIDHFLDGFARMETVMTPFGWGDALYVARSLLPSDAVAREWFSPAKGQVVPASPAR